MKLNNVLAVDLSEVVGDGAMVLWPTSSFASPINDTRQRAPIQREMVHNSEMLALEVKSFYQWSHIWRQTPLLICFLSGLSGGLANASDTLFKELADVLVVHCPSTAPKPPVAKRKLSWVDTLVSPVWVSSPDDETRSALPQMLVLRPQVPAFVNCATGPDLTVYGASASAEYRAP